MKEANHFYSTVVVCSFLLIITFFVGGKYGMIAPFIAGSAILACAAGGIGAVMEWDRVMRTTDWEAWEEEEDGQTDEDDY